MSEKTDGSLLAGTEGLAQASRRTMSGTRRNLAKVALGLVVGVWIGGGPDRYGEAEGIIGGCRGAARSMVKGIRYAGATVLDVVFQQRSSVRNLGLAQQVETRLWQDKRLTAEGIIVEVEQEGTAVLRGIVPDLFHKETAVSLAEETRGVSRVVDHLAISAPPRTIEATPAPAVPTGVATGVRIVR